MSDPLFSIGLTVETVQLKDITNNRSFEIKVSNSGEPHQEPTGGAEEGSHIPEICYLLLKYGVSIKFYHELAMECRELPRAYKVCI